jgi:hypothetical protein
LGFVGSVGIQVRQFYFYFWCLLSHCRTRIRGSTLVGRVRRLFVVDLVSDATRLGGPISDFLLRWPVSPSSAGCLRCVFRGGVWSLPCSEFGVLVVLGASFAPLRSPAVGGGARLLGGAKVIRSLYLAGLDFSGLVFSVFSPLPSLCLATVVSCSYSSFVSLWFLFI